MKHPGAGIWLDLGKGCFGTLALFLIYLSVPVAGLLPPAAWDPGLAEVLPQDKAAEVKQLQAAGMQVTYPDKAKFKAAYDSKQFDAKKKAVVEAPRGTLALGDVDPALEGTFTAKLKKNTNCTATMA